MRVRELELELAGGTQRSESIGTEELSEESSSIIAMVKDLHGEIDAAYELKEALEADLGAMKDRLAEEQAVRAELEGRVNLLEAKATLADQLREDISFAKQERDETARRLEAATSELEQVTAERDTLAGQKAIDEARISEIENDKINLEAKVLNLEERVVEMREQEEPADVAEAKTRPRQTSRQERPTPRVEDTPPGTPDVKRGFSIAAAVWFAVHAVFYYAGKAADKVVRLYSRAFKLDREYIADYNKSSGMAHARGGRWENAIPLLEKALTITPDDLETRLHLAEAYAGVNQYEQACRHLEKVLEARPDSARAVRTLGLICSRRQDYERAIEYLEKAVRLDPDHAETYYRLGVAYDNRKQYDQAVKSLKKAIALDPRFAKAYQALGFTHESMGDRESAVGCFKKALELE